MAQTYGEYVGSVTKVTNGPLGWVVRNADGMKLGDNCSSAGEAKKVLMQLSTGRMLTWTREDLNGGIESYRANAGR